MLNMNYGILRDSFVLVDKDVVHNMDTMGFVWVFSNGEKTNDIPDNWLSPIDYSKGKIHIRVTVIEKPRATKVNYLCRILVKRHSRDTMGIIGYRSVLIEKEGVYFFEEDLANIYKMTPETEFDLSLPLFEMQLVVADINGQAVHNEWEADIGKYIGYPLADQYFPLKLKYTAIVVPDKKKFDVWNDMGEAD